MTERPGKYLRIWLTILLPAFLALGSCHEDEVLPLKEKENTPETVPNEANQYVNSWILEEMEFWYLWNDDLPAETDKNLDPESYFNTLLNEQDRFSWIQSNYRELVNSLQGISKEAGYEFALFKEKEGSVNVVAQITYVKPFSPAATAGLKRGDMVSHINGEQITTENYQRLLSSVQNQHSVQYKPVLTGEEKFGESKSVTLAVVEYAENPNYLHKVIETEGKRIGYLVYNFFAPGTDGQPGKYDVETDEIVTGFKAQGVTDLILDLRYNSGGSESSAKNLASLLGRGIDDSKIFLRREYNDVVEDAILRDENLGPDFLISHFDTKANNIGNNLSSGRIYILTSSRTASASELIINSLKPFMDVFLIGDTTYGKNVGSISLFEEKDPKNTWGMQPIVVKVYNSLDQSDYGAGFVPDVIHVDNSLYLFPLGDPREALLAEAIGQITGSSSLSREKRSDRISLGHSLDAKPRSYNLLMDESTFGP